MWATATPRVGRTDRRRRPRVRHRGAGRASRRTRRRSSSGWSVSQRRWRCAGRRAVPAPVVVAVCDCSWRSRCGRRSARPWSAGDSPALRSWPGCRSSRSPRRRWPSRAWPARARTVLTAVVIAAGLSVAATGWVGVAWHVEPLALVSSGLWRASSTLTYANASASFLVTTLFLTAALADRLGPRRARLVTAALLDRIARHDEPGGPARAGDRPGRRGGGVPTRSTRRSRAWHRRAVARRRPAR